MTHLMELCIEIFARVYEPLVDRLAPIWPWLLAAELLLFVLIVCVKEILR